MALFNLSDEPEEDINQDTSHVINNYNWTAGSKVYSLLSTDQYNPREVMYWVKGHIAFGSYSNFAKQVIDKISNSLILPK
jgi:hypothetical protein